MSADPNPHVDRLRAIVRAHRPSIATQEDQ